MRFKIDENLHDDVTDALRGHGFDVHSVADEGMRGADDAALAARCRIEGRVLITLDLDFADINAYPPAEYPGIIVMRLGNQSRPHVLSMMHRLATIAQHRPIDGHLWIVTEQGIRVRGD